MNNAREQYKDIAYCHKKVLDKFDTVSYTKGTAFGLYDMQYSVKVHATCEALPGQELKDMRHVLIQETKIVESGESITTGLTDKSSLSTGIRADLQPAFNAAITEHEATIPKIPEPTLTCTCIRKRHSTISCEAKNRNTMSSLLIRSAKANPATPS